MNYKVVILGALGSTAIFGWLLYGHMSPLLRVAGQIDVGYALAAVACGFASYVMIGMALREVLKLLGHRLAIGAVLGIAFVSTSANYFISSMGVSGFALKAHLLRKRNVPFGATVTASVVTTAIMYAVLGLIILQGLFYLVVRMQGARIQILESVLGLALLGLTSVPVLLIFFNREVRSRLVKRAAHWLNLASFQLAKREIPREDFDAFERQLDEGLETIRNSHGGLTRSLGYTVIDWALTMGVLYFGFLAVGERLSVGHLTAGFAVGMASTLIPVLPGGLGAMEASMAAVFSHLGCDWETALVAVLIYRFAYYMLPGIVSIFLLWGLKMSEPQWVQDTVSETLPEELRIAAQGLERRQGRAE